MNRAYWLYSLIGVTAFIAGWIMFAELPAGRPPSSGEMAVGGTTTNQVANDGLTEATLFYTSDDGMRLVEFSRKIERLPEPTAQARAILEAQLAQPPAPLLSPIPAGTRLLAIYVTERGDAFVDLSEEITTGHSGGSLDELFTVYAIVNALTSNLSAINAVQILVSGREVDTLAGHVDLRRPLEADLSWVAQPIAKSTLQFNHYSESAKPRSV